VKQPDTLEELFRLMKRYGVSHFAGDVEVDFSCQACEAKNEAEEIVESITPVLHISETREVEEPEAVDQATGLTKSQADELFHSSEN
jgi:hypothetical protein